MTTYLPKSESLSERQLVRTSSIDLLVKSPAEAADKIRSLTEHLGGFLVRLQTNGARDATNATLTIRVPVARFAEMGAEIRKLSLRVESEQMEAEDVTRQYIDEQARLRNLHAQEAQYLNILKQAKTVKDTLEVSEKLNGVRGEIEQQQAEFETLSKQVDTVEITVSLRSQAEANVFGLQWRPLFEIKLAAMQGLEGLADYASAMFSLVFYLPAILLWLATILAGAVLGWRLLRIGARVLFTAKTPASLPVVSS
jgi:cell division protein FtsB